MDRRGTAEGSRVHESQGDQQTWHVVDTRVLTPERDSLAYDPFFHCCCGCPWVLVFTLQLPGLPEVWVLNMMSPNPNGTV